MLVLSRKHKESIVIGPDIEIRIIKVQGDRVRIGIEAPKELRISRKELLDATPPRDRGEAA